MVEKENRRKLLCYSIGAGIFSLSGCASFVDKSRNESKYEILVENDTVEMRQVTVQVRSEHNSIIFEHEYHISAGHLDESKTVETDTPIKSVSAESPALGKTEQTFAPPESLNDDVDIIVRLKKEGPEISFG